MPCAPVVVEIEVHTAEEHHQFHTRYNLDKYKALARQIEHLLGERLGQEGIHHSVVLNPELKGGWKPYFFVPNYYIKPGDKSRKFYPRLGSFEVTLRCAEDFRSGTALPPCLEVWSKLRTRRWPKPDRLVEDLASLLTAGREGGDTNSVLTRIKSKIDEAEQLRCSPSSTASTLNLAKPPAGPIAVSLRSRSRPESAPVARARPESAPPVGEGGKAPRRLQPLPRTSSASRPTSARPPRPASACSPQRARPASARGSPSSRPASARTLGGRSAEEEPPTPEGPAVESAREEASAEGAPAQQATDDQLLEACQLADLLTGPAEATLAPNAAAQQEAVPAAEARSAPSPRCGAYEEEFEGSECGTSPKVAAQPPPLEITAAVPRFGIQQENADEFEAEFEEPIIKGKADNSAESTDIDDEVGGDSGDRYRKSSATGGASTSGSTRGNVTPVDTATSAATGSFKDALRARLGMSRFHDEAAGSGLPSPAGGGGGEARAALPPKAPQAPANDPYDDFEEDFEEEAQAPSPTAAPAPAAPAAPAPAPAPAPAAPPPEAPPPAAAPVPAAPAAPAPAPTQAAPAAPSPEAFPQGPPVATAATTPSAGPAAAGPVVGLAALGKGQANSPALGRSQTYDPYDEGFEQTLTDEQAEAAAPAAPSPDGMQEGQRQQEQQQEHHAEEKRQQQTTLPPAPVAAHSQERPAAPAADPNEPSLDPYDQEFEQTMLDEPAVVATPEATTSAPAVASPAEHGRAEAAGPGQPAQEPLAQESGEQQEPVIAAPATTSAAIAAKEAPSAKTPSSNFAAGVTGDYDSDFEDD